MKIFLKDHSPHLLKEWDYVKNDIDPLVLTIGSNRRAWWICSDCSHEWNTIINRRTTKGCGCPVCATAKRGIKRSTPKKGKSLADMYPHLIKDWHPTKNNGLTPDAFSYGSGKKVWWLCSGCKYEWSAQVAKRTTSNRGCPACAGRIVTDNNRLSIKCPEVAAFWHPTKNDKLLPSEVSYGSSKRVWWLCYKCEHEWQTRINSKTNNGSGCPACSGQVVTKINCLATVNPKLAKEWHPTKNSKTIYEVTINSSYKAWWLCQECLYEWQTTVDGRSNERGCSACHRGLRLDKGVQEALRFYDELNNKHTLYTKMQGSTIEGQGRDVIEAVVDKKLNKNDLILFIESKTISKNLQKVLDNHSPEKYGGRSKLPKKTQIIILERDNWTCKVCGLKSLIRKDLHIDHIIPKHMGGLEDEENLQVLCEECNLIKGSKLRTNSEVLLLKNERLKKNGGILLK